jgi:hypothetical protein
MNEERRKILEMLSEGKITAEDAERLLEKIETGPSSGPRPSRKPGEPCNPVLCGPQICNPFD